MGEPIRAGELLDLGDYERARDDIRRRAMAARELRRVLVGPDASLTFENRDTVRYQIQEMLRSERIVKPEAIAEEAATYSELLPGPRELSATLMFELPEREERDRRLKELAGAEKHLAFEVANGGRARASFDPRQFDESRVSAVQFVRFPLTADMLGALSMGAVAQVVFDHPAYSHRATLSPQLVAALIEDLREAAGSASEGSGTHASD